MADMRDLGSRAARRKGSSPFPRTIHCGSNSVAEPCPGDGSSPVLRSITEAMYAPLVLLHKEFRML